MKVKEWFTRQWRTLVKWITVQKFAYILLCAGLLTTVLGYLSQSDILNWIDPVDRLIADFYANFAAELMSIALTVIVIDKLYARHQRAQQLSDLILQMGSPSNTLAREAVRILRSRGWIEDGSLRQAYLSEANLAGVDLSKADLRGACLYNAILTDATLDEAILVEADLRGAILRGARIQGTDLEKACLQGADLQRASLWETNFQGANLFQASFRNANQVARIRVDEDTELPDGTFWQPHTSLEKFRDPSRPDFWQSEVISPETSEDF